MKDVTVALELTLPDAITDQQIKSFVENAVTQHLLSERQLYREQHGAPAPDYDWGGRPVPFNVLGIEEHMIDVIGVKQGTMIGLVFNGFSDLTMS